MLDAVPEAQTTASSKAVKSRMMPTILHPDAIMISMHRVQAENKASQVKLVHQDETKQ